MIARNVTRDQIAEAAQAVGVTTDIGRKGKGWTFTLSLCSDKKYQRRGHTGRKVNAVCWHGHRDFMEHLFAAQPDATLISAMARYDGAADFRHQAEHTGERNIGSQAQPLQYRDACDCNSRPDG